MFQKLKKMWNLILEAIDYVKKAYKKKDVDPDSQKYEDITKRNLLSIAVSKVANLSCNEATFEVLDTGETHSTQIEPLQDLCKDLEKNKSKITKQMLGKGDYVVLPYFDNGVVKHSYLPQDRFALIDENEVEFAVELYERKNKPSYWLIRTHKMIKGSLHITHRVVDYNSGKTVYFDYPKWNELVANEIVYSGNNINMGYGRYKCPTDSRELETVYGVPLNFGCSEIEKNIFNIIKRIKEEGENGELTVFADEKIVEFDDAKKKIKKTGNFVPMRMKAGLENPMIISSPSLRFADHYLNLDKEYAEEEKQMGLSRGIYTENTVTSGATATEVKRSNSDTIAYIDTVHMALNTGNEETLRADGMFLNISPDLWTYSASWFDPFADPQEQWRTLLEAHNNGAEETTELIMWNHPELTREEAEEKLQRINDSKTNNTANAIYASLTQ